MIYQGDKLSHTVPSGAGGAALDVWIKNDDCANKFTVESEELCWGMMAGVVDVCAKGTAWHGGIRRMNNCSTWGISPHWPEINGGAKL